MYGRLSSSVNPAVIFLSNFLSLATVLYNGIRNQTTLMLQFYLAFYRLFLIRSFGFLTSRGECCSLESFFVCVCSFFFDELFSTLWIAFWYILAPLVFVEVASMMTSNFSVVLSVL